MVVEMVALMVGM